jgi:alkylhydroperoxidase family enzyme
VENREEIEARLRALGHAPELPPVDATRELLQKYCDDADGLDEVRDAMAQDAAYNPLPLRAALRAIEAVIVDPPSGGTLSYMVAVDANHRLRDPSDAGALEYLREIAGLLRDVLEPKSSA